VPLRNQINREHSSSSAKASFAVNCNRSLHLSLLIYEPHEFSRLFPRRRASVGHGKAQEEMDPKIKTSS
jgi:hypothetical protein